ncbi:MAG: glycosyltransferase [Thermoanaerobaculia bacterium]
MAFGTARTVKILFPYLARARTANWSRYQQLLLARARAGDTVAFLEPPRRASRETNFHEVAYDFPRGFHIEEIPMWKPFWERTLPFDKIVKKGVYSFAANRRVRSLLAQDPPDVLLIYNLTQRSLLRAAAPVCFDVADDLPAMLRHEAGAAGPALERVARRTLAAMLAKASLVTTPSREMLPRLGPRAVLVPNGVDPEEIRIAREGAAPREAGFRIGFLGSFEYFIDFGLVLDLAARLPDVRFLLVGGGRRHREVSAEVERRCLGNVELTGPLAHAAALSRIAVCDLTLCPFTRDPVGHGASPLKLFESLALAVPVLATRTREIGLESPPATFFADDAEEAASAVREYRARAPHRRREEGENASARILVSHSWDRIGADWARHVRSLTND